MSESRAPPPVQLELNLDWGDENELTWHQWFIALELKPTSLRGDPPSPHTTQQQQDHKAA